MNSLSGEKRWMLERMRGPIPVEIIYEVPKEIAEGTAPPGNYEMKIVEVIVPPPTAGLSRLDRFRIVQIGPEKWRIYDKQLGRYRYTVGNAILLLLRLQGLGCSVDEQEILLRRMERWEGTD
jgi:hypothetical protein